MALGTSGNVWTHFGCHSLGVGAESCASGFRWVETREVTNHPAALGTAPAASPAPPTGSSGRGRGPVLPWRLSGRANSTFHLSSLDDAHPHWGQPPGLLPPPIQGSPHLDTPSETPPATWAPRGKHDCPSGVLAVGTKRVTPYMSDSGRRVWVASRTKGAAGGDTPPASGGALPDS